ncbi:IS3 family transposase [uncultured Clostridium sp.]
MRIIKSEMYYLSKFDNFDELNLAIDNYIEFLLFLLSTLQRLVHFTDNVN